jgi:3-dehydroquinate synthase
VTGLKERRPDVLEHVIARSCELKARVVEQDEREETGLRAVLNYGHTFGHAIETVTRYSRYLHGEAVAIGMACAAQLSESLGRIDGSLTAQQRVLLEELGLPVTIDGLSCAELMGAMQRDKKAEGGQLRLVLPSRLGHVELVSDVGEAKVRESWRNAGAL